MLYLPRNRQVSITDGDNPPGNHANPTDLRNITQWVRSGGDISVVEDQFQRGPLGRVTREFGYLQSNETQVTDLSLELDDTATTGTSQVFEIGDVGYENERILQNVYATGGHTITCNCLVGSVGVTQADGDVLMMTVPLRGTGAVTVVGL